MIKTRLTDRLGIRHPIVLGGMSRATAAEVVGAVSGAGGLGILGISSMTPEEIRASCERIRSLTSAPFGLNALLFGVSTEQIDAIFACRPRAIATAWRRPDYDLRAFADRVHASGALHMHQADTLDEAKRAAEAGADVVVAQGTEGGGHVGVMATLPLARMVIRALPNIPVLVAGGIADGAGIAAALVLGADGVLLGTRFLATNEAPLPDGYKRAIVESDGHDTLITEIPDIVSGTVWPGGLPGCAATVSSRSGSDARASFAGAGARSSPRCRPRGPQATPTGARCSWERTPASSIRSNRPARSSNVSRGTRRRSSAAAHAI